VASEDRRIVRITGFDAFGRAELDTDGDGIADNDPALGITDEERAQLDSSRYTVDQTLWGVPISHFTPWDCNYPYVPPEDAEPPMEEPIEEELEDEFDCQRGSVIECQNLVLGESVAVAGSPFRLHYGGDRVPGRKGAYTISIPLSGATVPSSLERIELDVSVAGRLFQLTVPAEPQQRTSFTWDGLDSYGRLLQGAQPIQVQIGYVYEAVYAEPAAFGQTFAQFSGVPISVNRTRQEITLKKSWRGLIGAWDARSQGMGAGR
jgi:hypothetical protein